MSQEAKGPIKCVGQGEPTEEEHKYPEKPTSIGVSFISQWELKDWFRYAFFLTMKVGMRYWSTSGTTM